MVNQQGACGFPEAMLGARRKQEGPIARSLSLHESLDCSIGYSVGVCVSASGCLAPGVGPVSGKWLVVDVQNLAVSISAAGLPGRYAAALFGLAIEHKALDETAAALETVKKALAKSADFQALIEAGQVRRELAAGAISGIAAELKLPKLASDFLGVVANNGRLKDIPAIIRAFAAMNSAHKGIATAEVVSAKPLTGKQIKALEARLKARTGRTTALETSVDPALLGGLVVRIDSVQIDSSVRTRLEKLGQQMKGQA